MDPVARSSVAQGSLLMDLQTDVEEQAPSGLSRLTCEAPVQTRMQARLQRAPIVGIIVGVLAAVAVVGWHREVWRSAREPNASMLLIPASAPANVVAEYAVDSGKCSWDFTNCSATRCCQGVGMQCYAKDAQFASCKLTCTPGKVDPFDVDGVPWSCEELGERTPAAGEEETCDPKRVGANLWSGKFLHQGEATTPELCGKECSMKDWCNEWTFRHGSGGLCFLAEKTKPKSRRLFPWNPAPVKAKACRLDSRDLPASNCSAKEEENCWNSRCCQGAGLQCYKKVEGVAQCRKSCPVGQGWNCEKLGPKVCPACRPGKRVKPAIIIPTYERDLCKAVILARSIVKRDPNGLLGEVHLLWVSTTPAWQYADKIDEIRLTITGGGKVFKLLDISSELSKESVHHCIQWNIDGKSCHSFMGGWQAQEVLKLKVASLVNSDHYLLLDSKNALVNDVQEDTFFSPCNQGKVFGQFRYQDIPIPHRNWYMKAAELLGVEPRMDMYWPTSITPAVLHKPTVLEMLSQIGEGTNPYDLCDGPLCRWLGAQATEFTLYNMFAFAKSDRECIHDFQSPFTEETWGVSLWRGTPTDNLQKCESVRRGQVVPLTFGVQAGGLAGVENVTELRQQTEQCLTGVYGRAGLFDGSSTKKAKDEFIRCVS